MLSPQVTGTNPVESTNNYVLFLQAFVDIVYTLISLNLLMVNIFCIIKILNNEQSLNLNSAPMNLRQKK